MSSHLKRHPGRVLAILPATIAVLYMFSTLAAAQDQPAPKWEAFGGYSFLYPNAYFHAMLPAGVLPVGSPLESNPRGVGASLTYDFKPWFGLTLDGSTDFHSGENGLAMLIDDTAFSNLSLGPKFTLRKTHVAPFLEVLVGDHRLEPDAFHDINKLGFMFGGGIDFKVHRHIALRLPQVDYVMSSYRYGPSATTERTELQGIRAQVGIVFTWGGEHAVTSPLAACSVQPAAVFAGESVTATAVGSNFDSKRTVTYNWTGSGVRPAESGASTRVATGNLASGSYQITANLSDGSPNGVASCMAQFTIKEPHPPVIACSSDPASISPGGTATITSVASSPDGRRVTYSYTTNAGNVTGDSSSATLETAGASPGTITVTCTATDDHLQALTASSTTSVNLQAPPPPPLPDVVAIEKRLAIHSVYFATAKPRIEDPDAGLLGSQEKTLTALASDFIIYLQVKPDATLTLEGHSDPRGSVEYNQELSQRRVDRVKGFLTALGVPLSNIKTEAFGERENLTDKQVRAAVERNPELSPEDRQRVLDNTQTIILASNRRVDITLSNVGQASQDSVREFPFNAADSLTLLKEKANRKMTDPDALKRAKAKAQAQP